MESLFIPSEKSPVSVVLKMGNPDYCELKVVELLNEITNCNQEQYHIKMAQAISLLAMARAMHQNEESLTLGSKPKTFTVELTPLGQEPKKAVEVPSEDLPA